MRAKQLGKKQNDRGLSEALRPLREVDNATNLLYLAMEYLTIAAIVVPAIAFFECREAWGWAWGWNAPVAALAIILVGAVQHRLAGLGHESAHYALLKNKFWNDMVADVFCMFPIFATIHQYRLVHAAHHQYTNDWKRDPDLLNIGRSKMMDHFPMSRAEFVWHFYVKFFWPPTLLRYLWDIAYLSAFGKGVNPYIHEENADKPNELNFNFRLGSVLGVAYFFAFVLMMHQWNAQGAVVAMTVAPVVAWVLATIVTYALPDSAFFQSPLKQPYSTRFGVALRLGVYTAFLAGTAWLRRGTGINVGPYFMLLWALPLVTSFAYFMLLRDVYQHANADDGKLTNTRVFFTDPFTRWAVFVYGQDMHVPHHMYPAIPHYHLLATHRTLQEKNDEYRDHVVECHGLLANRVGKPTILDVMERPTREKVAPPVLAETSSDELPAVASSGAPNANRPSSNLRAG